MEGSKHCTRGRREARSRMWGEPSSLGHGAGQGQGMKGWGTRNSILRSQRSCSSPRKLFPGLPGEGKPSALEGFSVPGFPTKPLEPGKELALICWELQTPAAQAAGIGSGSAPGCGKSNPRGVERWNELRASILTVEGSSTGTKPQNLCISTGVAKPQ